MAKTIMLQGTSSNVGKSILTAAFCRIFHRAGIRVVPFKAQNMALNSYVTCEGEEMGRAQVVQAEAAGLRPMVDMNPVLLKPTGEACSQVILRGKAIGNMSARAYHQGYSLQAFSVVKEALGRLCQDFDLLVIEGAGSPAEVNLKAHDIVNMRVAKYLQAPVFLVADIDRGGALAALVGTLELLEPEERKLVKGLIINKFRGDVALLQPALDFLEEKTGKPVLGVVPYLEDLGIEEEDSVVLEEKSSRPEARPIQMAVIQLPKLSNFTDFDALAAEEDVAVYYVKDKQEIGFPDVIFLPGSKNTTEDLLYLRKSGLEAAIKEKAAAGTVVIGICGGYQMLGKKLLDPQHTESMYEEVAGMDFLPMQTTFTAEKMLSQVRAECQDFYFFGKQFSYMDLTGYEIHSGKTEFLTEDILHPFCICQRQGKRVKILEGAMRKDRRVWGTYLHGIFDHDGFRRQLINQIRLAKGLSPRPMGKTVYQKKQEHYEALADCVEQHLDMKRIHQILMEGES